VAEICRAAANAALEFFVLGETVKWLREVEVAEEERDGAMALKEELLTLLQDKVTCTSFDGSDGRWGVVLTVGRGGGRNGMEHGSSSN